MVDYKITINNGSFEQNYEFRKSDYKSEWNLYLTQIGLNTLEVKNVKSPYSITLIEDNDFVGYELYKGDEPIKLFEFEVGGLGNIPNLLEVLTYITKIS
jgi:hypothetical protein